MNPSLTVRIRPKRDTGSFGNRQERKLSFGPPGGRGFGTSGLNEKIRKWEDKREREDK